MKLDFEYIKIWVGELYIENKLLRWELERLKLELEAIKKKVLKDEKDSNMEK